ncbi:MAG: HD domain-containing protein [Dehalococcoidia bacterium]
MFYDFSAIWSGEPATWIRDAVWGDIPLYEQELALIDTPVFQRLRRVRQLGPLMWVFPGANHTRFEHALGVMHLARVLILQLSRQPGFPKATRGDLRVLVASALLHDVGHYPFSHALEDVERPFALPDHADVGAELVRGPIAPILRRHWRIDPERVATLVAGTGPGGAPPLAGIDGLWLRIVSGAVDVDRLDFLRRDALFANVPYGIVDVQRILASLRVWRDGSLTRLYLDEKGIGPLQSLIFGRFLMYGNVYWHHTSRIITRMIVRAVEDALVHGDLQADELMRLDDATLMDRLRISRRKGLAKTLVERIERRDLYKRSIELRPTDSMFDNLIDVQRRAGGRLAAEAALTRWASRVTGQEIPEDGIWLDLPQTRTFRPVEGVICKSPPPGYRNPVPWEAVSGLTATDLDRLARSVQRVRVLASSRELADQVLEAWLEDRDGVAEALGSLAA